MKICIRANSKKKKFLNNRNNFRNIHVSKTKYPKITQHSKINISFLNKISESFMLENKNNKI